MLPCQHNGGPVESPLCSDAASFAWYFLQGCLTLGTNQGCARLLSKAGSTLRGGIRTRNVSDVVALTLSQVNGVTGGYAWLSTCVCSCRVYLFSS